MTSAKKYNLIINIKFYDYWHCGSGMSGGSSSDALVARYEDGDKKDLPYVPARTLKGLIREMAEAQTKLDCKELQRWFGNSADKNNKCYKKSETQETETYLTNADIIEKIEKNNIPYLFKTFKNTALESNGLAVTNSLREIETVIPLELEATFLNIIATSEQLKLLKIAISSIKRIGLNRNRGFGRCEVVAKEQEIKEQSL